MPAVSFVNLLAVATIAFVAPLLLGLFPRLRLPGVVVEIVAGIAVGPAGLGWVQIDLPVQILAILGLAFLLFLAGMEVDLERLRGRALRLAGAAAALRQSGGRPLAGKERALLERRLAPARAELDPLVAAAAWKEGQSMVLEDAIADANGPVT